MSFKDKFSDEDLIFADEEEEWYHNDNWSDGKLCLDPFDIPEQIPEQMALSFPAQKDEYEQEWKFGNMYHRADGPAVVYFSFSPEWYLFGRKFTMLEWGLKTGFTGITSWSEYRNGKAVKTQKVYWQDGLIHRIDGPAVERPDGSVEWWLLGRRFDSASEWGDNVNFTGRVVCDNGHRSSWQKGKLHNLAGFAWRELKKAEWWIEGYPVSELEWLRYTKFTGKLDCGDHHVWLQKGLRHRVDGPAIVWDNGIIEFCLKDASYTLKEWGEKTHFSGKMAFKQKWIKGYKDEPLYLYLENGALHRTDGPALENRNGMKFWYCEGQLHREEGPAIVAPDGQVQWWLEGESLSRAAWGLQTHFTGVVEYDYTSNYKKCRCRQYFQEGLLHREDGPAIIASDWRSWWLGGVEYEEDKWREEKDLFAILHTKICPGRRRRISILAGQEYLKHVG